MLLPSDKIAQGLPVFARFAGNELGGLATTTPRASQHLIEHHVVVRKRSASAAGLGASRLAQIALGRAIIETKSRRVTETAGRIRVTHEHGMTRLLKRDPRVGLTLSVADAAQQRRGHAQDHAKNLQQERRLVQPQL